MLVLTTLALAAEPGLAPPEVEARLDLGWQEYAGLWVGDPILGGFDLYSPPQPLDRLLVSPALQATLRPGASHRLRVRASGRTLQRVSVLEEDLSIGHVWLSDGLPVDEAWRERLFLDEASWRWRPDGDPTLETRVGILPFGVAGRLFVESWPGASVRLDAQRQGWVPLAVEARIAATLDQSGLAALEVRHEPSRFEHVGLGVAGWQDRASGMAGIIEDDLGLLVSVWGASSADFLTDNGDAVLSALAGLYGDEVDGVRMFQEDLAAFLELGGSARVGYLSATGRLVLGKALVDLAVIHSRGEVELTGYAFPDGATRDEAQAAWLEGDGREPFDVSFPVRGWAFDAAVESLAAPLYGFGFVQGMSGEPDIVPTVLDGEPVGLFVAADQDFVRTRVFPADPYASSTGLDGPPGVGGHGLVSVGGGLGLSADPLSGTLQLALPMATHPSPFPPHGRVYGVEADALVGWTARDWLRLSGEAGVFQALSFFADETRGDRDSLADLPLGWRLWTGLTVMTP